MPMRLWLIWSGSDIYQNTVANEKVEKQMLFSMFLGLPFYWATENRFSSGGWWIVLYKIVSLSIREMHSQRLLMLTTQISHSSSNLKSSIGNRKDPNSPLKDSPFLFSYIRTPLSLWQNSKYSYNCMQFKAPNLIVGLI